MSADPRALVALLLGRSPTYKRAEVDAVVADSAGTAPILVELLRAAAYDPKLTIAELGGDLGLLYALVLVAWMGESAAHDPVADFALLPPDQFEALFGGFLTEDFDFILLETAQGRSDRLVQIIQHQEASDFVRAQAATALALQVHLGQADRADAIDFLAGLLRPGLSTEGRFFYVGVVDALVRLHAVQHRDRLLAAFTSGLVEPGIITPEFVTDALDRSAAAADLGVYLSRGQRTDVHDWMRGWTCFNQDGGGPGAGAQRRRARKTDRSARKRQKSARKKQRGKKKR